MSGWVPHFRYVNFSIYLWYRMRSTLASSPAWSIKIDDPAFMGRTMGWQEIIPSDPKRSLIYTFWPIFNVLALRSRLTFYSMIVFDSPRSFILNSPISWSLIHWIASLQLAASMISSTNTLTTIKRPSFLKMSMQGSALVGMNPIFRKNLIIVLFQSLPSCFRSFKLLRILQNSLSRPVCYPWGIFIKSGCLFCPYALSK